MVDGFDPAIRIVDHDPAWPGLAEAEVGAIEAALDDVAVRVEHDAEALAAVFGALVVAHLTLTFVLGQRPARAR